MVKNITVILTLLAYRAQPWTHRRHLVWWILTRCSGGYTFVCWRYKRWVGSESPCRAELPSADLHCLFFQIHPWWRFFTNIFYSKSSHRLKSISGIIIIIIVNNNNFDLIAILLLAGGLKATAEWIKISVDFYWKFERSAREFGNYSENKR